MWRGLVLGSALFACTIAPALADEVRLGEPTLGYTYFNRSGSTMDDHTDAVRDCVSQAIRTELAGPPPMRGLLIEWMNYLAERPVTSSAIENCMVVRGWKVVRIADEEGRALSAQPSEDVAARLVEWVGSDTPYGDVVRVWNNDALHGATDRYTPRPSSTRNGSLSVLAAGADARPTLGVLPAPRRARYNSIDPEEFGAAPAGTAIVIVQLRNPSIRGGTVLKFRRLLADGGGFSAADREIVVEVPLIRNRREGNWRAYAVPAGRWSFAAMGVQAMLGFCLGAPTFEVQAGEVIYAGAFDMSAETLGPDLTLDSARTWLAGSPAAGTVRAAAYTNGWPSTCGDNEIYAIEFEGVPFREGYHWGSAPIQ